MTESEVIEKLEFFKKAIINLKNENSSLAEAVSNFEIENGKTIENYEKQILSLNEENKKLNEENKKLNEENKALKKENKKQLNEYNDLKNKTDLKIKHLMEDVIKPKEKQAEEVNKRIIELENLLFEKNKDHKMVVKSAEKELTEMILGK